MQILPYISAAVAAYLLGSIPSGWLVARAHGKNVNLLRQGSGRTGATNVLRTLGWRAAALVFLGDFAKGVAAVAVARVLTNGDPVADVVAGLVSIVGHNYSLYLRFKGGRGVVTGLGTLLVIAPPAMLVAAILGIAVIALTRYVSLGSIVGSCSAPVALLVLVLALGQPPLHLVYVLAGALFVVASHKDNIARLLRGTERRLGERIRT